MKMALIIHSLYNLYIAELRGFNWKSLLPFPMMWLIILIKGQIGGGGECTSMTLNVTFEDKNRHLACQTSLATLAFS